MVQSMTGYGKAIIQINNKKISIEIKTLNSKNFDVSVRIPSHYKEKENEVRKILAESLERGKIECSIYAELTGIEPIVTLNTALIQSYIKDLQEVSPQSTEAELIAIAMRMPDVTQSKREEINEDEWTNILQTLKQAIENTVIFRQDEGKSLEKEFSLRINTIEKLAQAITQFEEERIQTIKQRLYTKLEELEAKSSIDENRFEQELIFYIEKLDISEEKVRLQNHIDYFRENLLTKESNGKKLGFITQEIGREINTMGSKANHAGMQKLVIEMKDELEKIKEQVLNAL